MRKQLEAWFLYFLLYSFLGWVYEVFLEVVVYRWGYSDRGVLLGPYCIVVLTTVLELIGSYVMEWTTGSWLWDYRRFAFNFQGRVALNPSLRFGVGGMVFLYVLQPLFEKLTDRMPPRVLSAISDVLAVLFLADVIHYVVT